MDIRIRLIRKQTICRFNTHFQSIGTTTILKQLAREASVQTRLIFGSNSLGSLSFGLSLQIVVLRKRHRRQNTKQNKDHDDFNQCETTLVVFHNNSKLVRART